MPRKTRGWSRQELLVAFNLYCHMPFGRMHSKNPEIARVAKALGRSPGSLAMKLVNFASLDPSITTTGRHGLGNVSRGDKAIWDEFNGDWEGLALESESYLRQLLTKQASTQPKLDRDLDEFEIENYEGETRSVQTKTRIKQSFFRKAVLSSYGGRCCITRLSVPSLLVASHIVPWKDDIKNRLNPRNGLCLSSLHDKAFDRHLIALDDDFRIVVSPALLKFKADQFLRDTLIAIEGKQINLPEKFLPDLAFIRWHRERTVSNEPY